MAPGKTAKMKRVAMGSPLSSKAKRACAASPGSMTKMKRACSASPDEFASALLHILDGTVGGAPASGVGAGIPEAATLPPPILPSIKRRSRRAAKEVNKPKTGKRRKLDLEEQERVAARRKGLRALKLTKIKELAQSKGLDIGTKDKMIDEIIALESKRRDNVRKHRASVKDVIAEKREEFSVKKNKELNALLQAYALKTGGTKPARVERLLAMWQEQGEIEKVLAGRAFQARKAELQSLSKDVLYNLCRKKGVDALSKDILVERLLVHESVEIWQEVLESRQSVQ